MRWAGHKEVEKLQPVDTVLFARKGEGSFLPGWNLGIVKEVEESSDLEVRVVLIRYAGEILKKGNEKPKPNNGGTPEVSSN